MKISHHLDDATLWPMPPAHWVKRTVLLWPAHAAMCPECRAAVRAAETVGGMMLDDQDGNCA